jgi:polyisoprenoid-binding protein YceI
MIIIAVPVIGGEKNFIINPASYQNVTFHSKATIESFKGETTKITGSITVDPEDLKNARAKFIVDMRSLDTGIGLRNEHMQKNHLHTGKFPNSEFKLRDIQGAAKLIENDIVSFSARGEFELHGVSHRLEAKIQVTFHTDGLQTPTRSTEEVLHIRGEFNVKLSDYDIPLPKFLFMKLAETQRVTLDFWAVKGVADGN